MARGWFLPAWLEYGYYWGLACSIGLVYHGLNYSSSSINKPATKRGKQTVTEGATSSRPRARAPTRGSQLGCAQLQTQPTPQPLVTSESTGLGFPSWFMFACFYHSRTLPFHLFMGELAEFSGNNTSNTLRDSERSTKTGWRRRDARKGICYLPLISDISVLCPPFSTFFFFLSKPSPTSCKPNSLLMPTIKIMNCDGRTPSNEGTSGVLSPLSHTAGDFRALHSL